ncbi:glycoside hydrolase family 3 C-terminal domain-containing protein [Glycomyces sp. TRM65418]|uniref:beta-xylosidase/alpha-l-arabinosidase n=1 Tax=Glycomyces sp. TRM65418 TaxID=2867006 RepID=UPI001CE60EE7|nr:glycoside hydrolase family 3 N-terminal domain-containing protein [Glycomyces sp. TRM65418]MCC3765904.1 glycoside hydrolase family 3 C-terminal domain-containing protein [Glycomyces sp. TRM65418]QZD55487.1 glycoside hydrolase family 3 C-terminal domain-containing protein [Glycomyces sp. TRM65418]
MVDTWRDPAAPVEARVEALLAEMTVEEKLAQLGSFWPPRSIVGDDGEVAPMEDAMNGGPKTLEDASLHGLGHLTRAFGTEPVAPAEGAAALERMQRGIVERSRLGVPAIAHEECLTGFTTLGATVYPTSLAWAATFAPDLIERMARHIGADMRAVGVHQGLSPVLDVVRDYRWGRVEETMGEDPYLVGTIGSAYVRGLESAGIIATLKHFAGYSASRGARNHAPVPMGPRELADVILPPFEMAVRLGGARSVMNSYSDVDGLPAAANRELLTGILREQWGFTGTVVSDYWAIAFLDMMHRVSADRADSGAQALTAGIDVELPGTDAYALLADKIASGALDESTVDTAVRRVLRQKAELGLLDADPALAAPDPDVDLDSPANRALAREIAAKSVVLLDNDGTLPLGAPASIALIGPTADDSRTLLGCYSFPNHVLSRYEDRGTGVAIPSLLDALRAELPDASVAYERGVPIREADRSGIAAAVDAATAADVCVLAVGDLASLFGRGTSGEGCDAADLTLPGVQAELVEAVLATGTPVVLVVVSGRPYALGSFAHRCAAVVQAFLPGEEGGDAVAGVLSGRINPSGHLPVGIPYQAGGQPGTYLAPPLGQYSEGVSNIDPTPLYAFGHGRSYTEFAYSDLELSTDRIGTDGELDIAVTVANTGDRPGEDVVQLYLTDEVAQVTRPVRELAGYARIALQAGESTRVTFRLHADRTSFTGRDGVRVVEPGDFTVAVGHSSADLPLTGRFRIEGALRAVEGVRVMTTGVQTTGN